MKAAVRRLLVLLAVGASGRLTTTPVDRVISLLTKLSAQVQAEGAEEAASYDKYACFCKDNADSKVYDIAKSDEKINELDATITKLESEIAELDADVVKSKEEVEKEEKTAEESQKARTEEQEEYEEKHKDMEDAVKAVDEAIVALQHSEGKVAEVAAALVQKLPAALSSSPALALIAGATAGRRFTGSATPAGQPKGYAYQSKDIIATLQSLQITFKKELADLEKAEITAQGDFEMVAGARSNTIKALKKDITEKETVSASKGEEKSEADDLKTQETTARNADQAFLDDLTAKCEKKAKAWDQRSTTRASELTALTEAVNLLKGMGDLYSTNSKLVGLISKKSQKTSFLQLQSFRRHASNEVQLESLINHLQDEGRSLKSVPLKMLAMRLKMVDPDHFVKVRGLIKDLIAKLEADAASEATAKSVCDQNMKEAVEKRDEAAANYETAGAQIDSTNATINSLESEIASLAEDIAKLHKQQLEATELREKEKAENTKTIANADQGKADVDQAITLLKDFYGEALFQVHKSQKEEPKDREGTTVGDSAPKTFSSDEEYKGKVDSSKGVIGMLEVIASDFERTSTTTADREKEAEEDYEELKGETETSIADKEKLKKEKVTEVETKKSELTQFKDDKITAKKMNEQAIEELEKLSSSCVDTGETYAERKKHREEEIEALKQALTILEEWKS